MGGNVRNGVLIAIIERVIGSGDDVVARPGAKSDTLEQLAATINRDKKNNRFIRL